MLNAFTIDVEDYYHVSGFEKDIDRCDWPSFESRVERNVARLLDLLDDHQVQATFYVLGWVAERFPNMVGEINSRGHEIGSHGYWHRLIYHQTPQQFREDLRRARDVLEDIVFQPVTAYRAPSFSITRKSLWALEILIQEGFTLDSSIFPTRRNRYGIHNAEPRIHEITTPSGRIWEFPPSVLRVAGVNVPVSGGGYFRLKPWKVAEHCLRHINRRCERPFVFYVHPWEIDPQQPRLDFGSRMDRWRHYVNLDRTERKLGCLLRQFDFGPVSRVTDQFGEQASVRSVAYAPDQPLNTKA